MRILALADLHCDEIALERAKALYDKEDGFDLVLIAGDIAMHSISFLDDVITAFPDCYAIPGNCDLPEVPGLLERNGRSLHKKRVELSNGMNIVGFGFSPPTPFGTPGELSEKEIYDGMEKLAIDNNTILITHSPPYGIFDSVKGEHVGSTAIRRIIEEKKPFANLCAHIHEHFGVKMLGETHIVKIPAANMMKCAVVEIKNKKLRVQFISL